MKIYHQLGHNHKWALDSHFKNGIGDGFIFSAYSFKYGVVGNNVISSYAPEEYMQNAMIDLQYYGNKDSVGGSLGTYPFNPLTLDSDDSTVIKGSELIVKGIDYQISLGLKNIIIPMVYDHNDTDNIVPLLIKANKKIKSIKKTNNLNKFFMTVPFSNETIVNKDRVETLLQTMTDIDICFDGYYIVCDYSPQYKKKISINYDYYGNLLKVFSVLNMQGFKTIHGYANWDALVFNALADINYTTIGTYENLRRFSIERFTVELGGGPSKGWYFSEKLLNFIRAEELTKLRNSNCLDLIANEKNIFSDVILAPDYIWNTHKPEVHKNYLLSISRLLSQLHKEKSVKKRGESLLKKIEDSRNLYAKLHNDFKVYLNDENSDYHLGVWSSFIKQNITD